VCFPVQLRQKVRQKAPPQPMLLQDLKTGLDVKLVLSWAQMLNGFTRSCGWAK